MKTIKQLLSIVALAAALNTTQAQSWLTNGLIAYYPFNGNVKDESGSGNDGTLSGTVLSLDRFGQSNSSLRFPQDPSSMTTSGVNFPVGTQEKTLSVWVKPESLIGHMPGFASFGGVGASGNAFGIGYGPNSNAYFWGHGVDIAGSSQMTTNSWYHLCATLDSLGNVLFYQNGQVVGSLTNSGLNTSTGGLLLGRWFALGPPFVNQLIGSLDEVRIYNRTLSANEIAQLYAFESHTPLFDNFTDSVIDGSKWEVRKTFGDSDVFVDSGNAVLLNRGKLLSQMPMPASIRINVRFKFTGSQNDVFRVVWRSNGDDSNISNGARELLNWVGVSAQQAHSENGFNGSLSLDWINHPFAGGSLAFLNTNLLPNTYYELRIVDDGSNINVFWGTNTTPILTGNIPSSWGNRLGLYNREGTGGGSSISAGSQVKIDYVRIEDRTCTPHKATAIAIIENGQVVGAAITDGGCGYTNTPLLLIQGGGGSGALATTTMVDGEITSINLINGGSGYSTNPAPKIVIASPPFVPTVSIRVSRVEVVQHVTLGRNYVLESSTNLVNWSATGPLFTAVSENYTNEFVIGQIGSFFRLREVP